jgi:DNA-binding IclR family transcriptional regulator
MAFSGAKGKVYNKIRQDGFIHAVSDRVPGLVGVSAPVFKGDGQLVGALTLTVPESRFQQQFVGQLRASAHLICEQLG